jgi:hypothetical protein
MNGEENSTSRSPTPEFPVPPGGIQFYYDRSRLPREFNEAAFTEAVSNSLRNDWGAEEHLALAAVVGLLLIDEQFDHQTPGFRQAIGRAYQEYLERSEIEPPTIQRDFISGDEAFFHYWSEVAKTDLGPRIWEALGKYPAPFEILRVKSRQQLEDEYELKLSVEEYDLVHQNLPPQVSNKLIFARLASWLPNLPGDTTQLAYQELALAARFLTRELDLVPFYNHRKFFQQADISAKSWARGGRGDASAIGSLELPPIFDDPDIGVDIVPENIRAVAMINAAYYLEGLLDQGDRAVELYQIGHLAIGNSPPGRKLDEFLFSSEDRLTKTARFMHYSRVLGVSGGEVSRETRANTEYRQHFLSSVSNLSALGQALLPQQVLNPKIRVPLSGYDERARKSIRELAANASLFGYASAHFVAKRLSAHVRSVLDIFGEPELQRALGVQGPWQVAERLASLDGIQFNVVRQHRLAVSTKTLLDLIARYHHVWGRVSRRPLFTIPGHQFNGDVVEQGDIPAEDTEQFLRQAEHWLAVNGVQDEDVYRAAQPSESAYAPTIPSYGFFGGNGNGAAGTQRDQLLQRIARGELVSPEEARSALVQPN